jgi:hypothetical protein
MWYQSPLFAPTVMNFYENLKRRATGCPGRDQHGRAADPECSMYSVTEIQEFFLQNNDTEP